LTNIEPTTHPVQIGYVVYAHQNNGKIFVSVSQGVDQLDELHDVSITSVANNDGLFYDSATTTWKNKTIATALGYTPFQLPALTSGSVLFSNGTTIAQDNSNLFWDDTNNRLGIGTNNPSAYYAKKLVVACPDEDGITILANTVSSTNYLAFADGVTGNEAYRGYVSYKHLTDQLTFGAAGSLRMTLTSGGNLLLNTTTDAGYKLDVNGTARVSGAMTITPATLTGSTATSALDISQTWNTTGTPTAIKLNITNTASNASSTLVSLQSNSNNIFRILNTGQVYLGSNNNIGFWVNDDGTNTPLISGRTLVISHSLSTQSQNGIVFRGANSLSATSGTQTLGNFLSNFTPTSGNAIFNSLLLQPTINQTGGASGITRGLYINPTLTSAADFRAIEVANGITILGASTTAKASLRIPSGTAPTTPTNGDIWFDGTNLKMQIGGVTKTFTLL
jgi:hypothetical protein